MDEHWQYLRPYLDGGGVRFTALFRVSFPFNIGLTISDNGLGNATLLV